MERKSLDWQNIGFGYRETELRYVSEYKDGVWDEGVLTGENRITMVESAGVLQYAQTCFEGLKAYETVDKRIVTFRPDLNAQRMIETAKRLEMPPFPAERFIEALDKVVRANEAWVPPYGSGATLYIRPFMFGSSAVIGVNPAEEYQFRMFVTPVGPYFNGGLVPNKVKVSDFDRAAPRGTGNIKAGLNYAMSLHQTVLAHKEGFAENVYLDPATRTMIEETGGANIIFVDKEGRLIVPLSSTDSILPSVTRRSIVYVAREMLGIEVIERVVKFEEVGEFTEMGLCGTAAVISPVGMIDDHGREIYFPSGMETAGPVITKLYETLTGIQVGTVEAPEGWIHEIPE
ncbi:MAG: branched-chain amino acid aminotransferase [Lachnospiraceae bacterium]|nr:branched-chain amino acid aminotransferase [Lachnospiraceae bacterium]